MHIVIGFNSTKGSEDPRMLYCGADRGEALEMVKAPPAGVARVEVFSHPQPAMRKFFEPVVKRKVVRKAAAKKAKD